MASEDTVSPVVLKQALSTIKDGGARVAEGVALLLISKAEEEAKSKGSSGVKTTQLQRWLKVLSVDPYLALGLDAAKHPSASTIKKAWRTMALKYHPDKTQNRTSALFTVIQQGFAFLSDDTKRAALDRRLAQARERAKQAAYAARNRQRVEKAYSTPMQQQKEQKSTSGSPFGVVGSAPPTAHRTDGDTFSNQRRSRPKSAPAARRSEGPGTTQPSPGSSFSSSTSYSYSSSAARGPGGQAAAFASGRADTHGPLAKPAKLRLIERSDCSATLSWEHRDFDKLTMATSTPSILFELQWRSRMERAMPPWEVSSFLLRSNTCRKKNLKSSTCYEFRIRATSTDGSWSAFSDTAFAVTLGKAAPTESSSGGPASSSRAGTPLNNDQKPPSSAGMSSGVQTPLKTNPDSDSAWNRAENLRREQGRAKQMAAARAREAGNAESSKEVPSCVDAPKNPPLKEKDHEPATTWKCAVCARNNDIMSDLCCGACGASRQSSAQYPEPSMPPSRAPPKHSASNVRPLSARTPSFSRTSQASESTVLPTREAQPSSRARPKSASAVRSAKNTPMTWSSMTKSSKRTRQEVPSVPAPSPVVGTTSQVQQSADQMTENAPTVPAATGTSTVTADMKSDGIERVEYKPAHGGETSTASKDDARVKKQQKKQTRPKSAGVLRSSASSLGRNIFFSSRREVRQEAAGDSENQDGRDLGEKNDDAKCADVNTSKVSTAIRRNSHSSSSKSPTSEVRRKNDRISTRSSDGAKMRDFFQGKHRDKSPARPSSAPASRRRPAPSLYKDNNLDTDKSGSTATVSTTSSSGDGNERSNVPVLQSKARPSTAGSSRRAVTSALLSRSTGGSSNITGGRLRDLIARANARTKATDVQVVKVLDDLCKYLPMP
jgi:curved DNA-binding protein CbpA